MTTEPDPPHTGVRPLSPYGEGYCRWCWFTVGLDCSGLLDGHSRGLAEYGQRKPCPGSLTRPPKRTPYSSRKAAFKVKAEEVWCPGCKSTVAVTVYRGERLYSRHTPPYKLTIVCPYSFGEVKKD